MRNEFHSSIEVDRPETDKFQALVDALSQKLGPSSGIDSKDVDARELQDLMEKYMSNESEWQKYAFADPSRPYTRNLVDKGNGKSNLVRRPPVCDFFLLTWSQLILVWTPNKGSPIHE